MNGVSLAKISFGSAAVRSVQVIKMRHESALQLEEETMDDGKIARRRPS